MTVAESAHLNAEQQRLAPTWRCMDTKEFAELARDPQFVRMIIDRLVDSHPANGVEATLTVLAQYCMDKYAELGEMAHEVGTAYNRMGMAIFKTRDIAKGNWQ